MNWNQPGARGFVVGTAVALLAAAASPFVMHLLAHISDWEWLYHHTCQIAIVDGLSATVGGIVGAVCGARLAWRAPQARGALVGVAVLDGLLVIGGLVMLLIGGVLELMRHYH